uniref:G-protein coupled receptors family 1 profile domain-containing protein n=1 Tax=Pelusios castaneus TaxID=367368 RepID=A0A8C8SHN6_9SAUR
CSSLYTFTWGTYNGLSLSFPSGIVSLFGNSLLLLVAYRKRSMLKPAEFFIVNLAISDLGMTGTLFPLATPSFFAHRWLFNHAMCTFYAFSGMFFGLCSLTSLTVLSTLSFLSFVGNKFSPTHAAVLLLCVWAYALIFAIAPLANWGSYGPEPYGTACCLKWKPSSREAMIYIVALFLFCYLFPCLLILISYSLILWTVKVSRRSFPFLFQLSIAVCVGFLAAWTPYAIVAMWAAFGDASQVPALAFAVSAVFAKSSTTYNPLVYLLFKPNFQKFLSKDLSLLQALRAIICCSHQSAVPLQSFQAREGRTSARLSTAFPETPGACRNCTDTFECFSNYPRCYNLTQQPNPTARLNPLAEGPACQPTLKRTVQVMVVVTRNKSGIGTTSMAGNVLPFNIVKDLI